MKLSVTLDCDEDGVWIAECPAIPGCVSQGKTEAAASKNIEEAIALCLEVRNKRGMPLTLATKSEPVVVPHLSCDESPHSYETHPLPPPLQIIARDAQKLRPGSTRAVPVLDCQ